MNWFKFYGQEWLSDPKLFGLSTEDKICFISLLCLASTREDGVIKNITEDSLKHIARLYLDPTCLHKGEESCEWCRATGVLKRLEDRVMLRYDSNVGSNGAVTLCNYLKRQQTYLTNAERQKRYRQKKNNKQAKI